MLLPSNQTWIRCLSRMSAITDTIRTTTDHVNIRKGETKMNFKQLVTSLFVRRIKKESDTLYTVEYRNSTKDDWKKKEFYNHDEAFAFYVKRAKKIRTDALFIMQKNNSR